MINSCCKSFCFNNIKTASAAEAFACISAEIFSLILRGFCLYSAYSRSFLFLSLISYAVGSLRLKGAFFFFGNTVQVLMIRSAVGAAQMLPNLTSASFCNMDSFAAAACLCCCRITLMSYTLGESWEGLQYVKIVFKNYADKIDIYKA